MTPHPAPSADGLVKAPAAGHLLPNVTSGPNRHALFDSESVEAYDFRQVGEGTRR